MLLGKRMLESHPLTIACAPPSHTCLTPPYRGVLLGARVCGDWTRALNTYARKTSAAVDTPSLTGAGDGISTSSFQKPSGGVSIRLLLSGTYGGISIDLGTYERILLVAGGSGITFALGTLDDLVGRIVRTGRARGERTRAIELVWFVPSLAAVHWFVAPLEEIARAAADEQCLDVKVKVYITRSRSGEQSDEFPNCSIMFARPSSQQVLDEFLRDAVTETRTSDVESAPESVASLELRPIRPQAAWQDNTLTRERVAVGVAGPAMLVHDLSNQVARRNLTGSTIALHAEIYAI
jgi:ferric-chelate reductase